MLAVGAGGVVWTFVLSSIISLSFSLSLEKGSSGVAMVLGKLPVLGRSTNFD